MKKKKQKCVIYLRTSTQDQKEKKTIEAQRRECQRYAESQNWEIVETIADEAMSGAFSEQRTGWQAVKQIMKQGKTDIILVPELSRITRTSDLRERGDILQTFVECQVNLATPSRGIIDLSEWQNELLTGIELSIARQERETIAKRMRRGRLAKLEQGQYCHWSVPYGLKRRSDKNVKPVKHYVEKHPDEYDVMRTVYEKIVVEGLSLNDTVVYLNDTGIKTRSGKRWQVANLSHMLKKDSLTGTIVANRHIHQMTAEGSRRVLDKNGKPMFRPQEEWISVPVPAIYTKKEYKALRQRLEENRCGNPKRNKPDDPFWLKGKLRCGLCGAMYGAKPTSLNYYMCGDRSKPPKHRVPGEEKCLAPVVNADLLHHFVESRMIFSLLVNPEKVLKEWTRIRSNKTALKRTRDKLAKKDKDIKKVSAQLERLLDEFVKGVFPESTVEQKAEEFKRAKEYLENERDSICQELDSMLEVQANVQSFNESVESIRAVSGKLAGKIKSMTLDEKKSLIGHLLPYGSYIEIFPIGTLEYGGGGKIKRHHRKPYLYKFKGKNYHIAWEYSPPIIRNLDSLVQALKRIA